jgi:hypothetical protein
MCTQRAEAKSLLKGNDKGRGDLCVSGLRTDQVRRAEFFRKGGAAREIVKGERWLLLSRWAHLNTNKKRQLNELFTLNQRVMKAYLLKESPDRLWNYTYEGAMLRYLNSWIDQLRWQRLKPMEKLTWMLLVTWRES